MSDRPRARRGKLDGMKFHTVVELGGKTATGLEVPDHIVTALGAGRRPAVRIGIGGHTYRTTVASMGGRYLVPLNADNRTAAGVSAGDEVEVDIEIDHEPRAVVVPADLAAALAQDATAKAFFDQLAFTHRKEWVRWVQEAKKNETRTARIPRRSPPCRPESAPADAVTSAPINDPVRDTSPVRVWVMPASPDETEARLASGSLVQ